MIDWRCAGRRWGTLWVWLCLTPVVVGMFSATGCRDASDSATDPNAPVRIAVTIRPLALLARDVIGEAGAAHIEITTIVSPSASPHGFEPTPADMRALSQADVIVCNGLGLDSWSTRTLSRRQVLVRFADAVGAGDAHDHGAHDHDHDHDHDHGEDEHLWLDVVHVRQFASHLAIVLKQVASDRTYAAGLSASIDQSLAELNRRIDEVDSAYRRALDPHQDAPIVTFHSVLSRVADRYGLHIAAVLRPIESLEPAPDDIRRAVQAITSHGVVAIFVEPQFSSTAAERIASETGIGLVTLDPLGSDADSWAGFMMNMLDSITTGLQQNQNDGDGTEQ